MLIGILADAIWWLCRKCKRQKEYNSRHSAERKKAGSKDDFRFLSLVESAQSLLGESERYDTSGTLTCFNISITTYDNAVVDNRSGAEKVS